jgi:hypothetical protein
MNTDDDILQAVERAEDEVDEQVRNYHCDSITADGIGNGWFDINVSRTKDLLFFPEIS